MKLLSEKIGSPSVDLLTENTSNGKYYYIEGIFAQAEVLNGNRRRYPSGILIPEIERYVKESVNNSTATGELDHPETPSLNLKNVSHLIVELKPDGNDIYGKARLLNTQAGIQAQEMIKGGVKLGVSTRGLATITEMDDDTSIVNEDFRLYAIDIVGNPSAPSAYVNGVLESIDWNKSFYEQTPKVQERLSRFKALDAVIKALSK